MKIQSITVIGLGLIGGSIALALKQGGFEGTIVGCDFPDVLAVAGRRGAIDAAEQDRVRAVSSSQLVVLAAPVAANRKLLGEIAPHVPEGALITDAGSTKADISAEAGAVFGPNFLRRFLPGHPMAGKEVSGMEHADAGLFRNAPWVLTPPGGRNALIDPALSRGVHSEFIAWLERIGARVVVTTAETHDRVLAYTSHLPQVLSTALAACVSEAVGEEPALRELSGRALRDMIRLAKSNPQVWAEISAANRENLGEAIERLERQLAALRTALGTEIFREEFARARQFDPDAELVRDDTDPPKFR
ncbi:MAG TPA: prephenate dehydrogenase [Clostridia bacterium]|nr:prephenate dehydrogenase [Clostridia bacterium]